MYQYVCVEQSNNVKVKIYGLTYRLLDLCSIILPADGLLLSSCAARTPLLRLLRLELEVGLTVGFAEGKGSLVIRLRQSQ